MVFFLAHTSLDLACLLLLPQRKIVQVYSCLLDRAIFKQEQG
jgi:hypothetical protein